VWAGLIEEPAKLIVIYIILHKKNYKHAINGVLIGAAVGTGFAVMETLSYIMRYTFAEGYMSGLDVAIARGLGSFSSHGTYAAIYGGGLMIAKGSHKLNISHIFNLNHLVYFVAAMILHACNNSMTVQVYMYGYLGEYGWVVTETLIMFALLFLPLIKRGVNQVVDVCTSHNGGRVTMAVNRAPTPVGRSATAAFTVEGVSGPMAGHTFPLYGRLTIGRAPSCDISMPGATNVSGNHCVIEVYNGQITVTDLGSTNGTYINGQRLTPNQQVPVFGGTVIYLGNQSCGFAIR
jgi:hypothetical protein